MDRRESRERAKRWELLLPLGAGVVLFALLASWGAIEDSQTWDEAMSIAAGFRQSDLGSYEVLWENPPLLGWLVYLPFKAQGLHHPGVDQERVAQISPVEYGRRFLYFSGNDHRRALLSARWAVLAVSLIAVGAVVAWAYLLHGTRGAWIAAALAGSEPSWLAHGRIAAFDGVATATITLTLFAIALCLQRLSWRRAAVCGVLLGLSLASKHTAVLLVPLFVVLAAMALSPLARRWMRVSGDSADRGPAGAVAQWAIALLLAALVLGITYHARFDYGLYLRSLLGTYRLGSPGYENYLLGEFSSKSFPWYYLVAAAVKTPVGLLMLIPIGTVATVRCPTRALWIPAALWVSLLLVVTSLNPHNLGYRHFLPAVPALIVLASGAARWRGRAAIAVLTAVLPLVSIAESVSQAPQHLAFFNVLAGGPEEGIRFLDDSNIDWGQDLNRLARLQEQEAIGDLALVYFGSADPSSYGVDARQTGLDELLAPNPSTTYAVSIHLLNRLPRRFGIAMPNWLDPHRAWLRAGRSILLFRPRERQ